MGDNYFGAPIIGTTTDFFANRTARGGQPLLAAGAYFTRPFEAVVGADVARRFSLTCSTQFVGSHGWGAGGHSHGDHSYTVVGVLAPTGTSLDRAVYTHYHSVWEVHGHHHHAPDVAAPSEAPHAHAVDSDHLQVTSLLVRLTRPGRRYQFVEGINGNLPAMAAVPVDEINKVTVTFLSPLQNALLVVAYLVVAVSGLGILATLYLTIHQRRRDIAILRSLGATRGDVFRLIALEAAAIAGLGVLLGVLFGHSMLAAAGPYCLREFGVAPAPWQLTSTEAMVGASVWAVGILAGLLPAALAYRLPVVEMGRSEV
jgi:putative ABC transport system permease protein